MTKVRVIPRLDIKAPNLIKGIQLEGLRKIGDPNEFAVKYYKMGADELLYIDIVASLYGRNSLTEIISRTAQDVFIPLTVGGGVRSTDDVRDLLLAGADKVAINTAAVQNPNLITDVANRFGSQCMVLSIEAKRVSSSTWEAYTDNGREHTHLDAVAWAAQAESLGAGEILITSVDREGTRKGFDYELVHEISKVTKVPLIASGGMGKLSDLSEVVRKGGANAVAIADMLHYDRVSIEEIKAFASSEDIETRSVV